MNITIKSSLAIHELGSRSNQEDSIFPDKEEISDESCVYILCDGMGGHENGEVASLLVCSVLSEYINKNWDGGVFTDHFFQSALDEVYRSINQFDDTSNRRMGTTLAFLCFHKGGAFMAHVGDSRIYHIRPAEHRILYKSRDHSLAYDLYLSGEISHAELATYKKNVITRAIMPNQNGKAGIAHSADIQEDDYFFMCSDGMLEQIDDDELLDILCSEMKNEKKQEYLIEKTKDNKDNHSAFVIQINDVIGEDDDSSLFNDESVSLNNSIFVENRILKSNDVQQNCFSKPTSHHLLRIVVWTAIITFVLALLIVVIWGQK